MYIRRRPPSPEKDTPQSAEKRLRDKEVKKKKREEEKKLKDEELKRKRDPKYKAKLAIHDRAKNWTPINRHDDYRVPYASKNGGF
jgi:hypothetical protein